MENNLMLVVSIAIFILWAYNRYLILTSRMALKERQKLTAKIGDFIDSNDKVSYDLKETLIAFHHMSMTKSLLNKFLFASFFKKEQALNNNKEIKDTLSESEYKFLKECITDMFKINFLYTPIKYITYGILFSLVVIIFLLLAIISAKLIGGFKAVDKFINRDTDFVVSSLNIHRI